MGITTQVSFCAEHDIRSNEMSCATRSLVVSSCLSLRAILLVARMIVEIAERQEQLVGDGTTTAVVMVAEMIKETKGS